MEEWQALRWIAHSHSLVISAVLLVSLLLAFALGHWIRASSYGAGKTTSLENSQEGMIVSGVLVVLGLLLAFTFGLSLDRFEQRRLLVVAEANALGTSYLRSQLLDEPDRSRLSDLLRAYRDNRIVLATASGDKAALLQRNDQLLMQVWAAVSAAVDTPKGRAVSTPLLLSFNELIDYDTERRIARTARVPALVMLMLYIFLLVTAAVIGFVVTGRRPRIMASIMLLLLTLAMNIILDLNQPTSGMIVESQEPMLLMKGMLSTPKSDFDRYKEPAAQGQQSPKP